MKLFPVNGRLSAADTIASLKFRVRATQVGRLGQVSALLPAIVKKTRKQKNKLTNQNPIHQK